MTHVFTFPQGCRQYIDKFQHVQRCHGLRPQNCRIWWNKQPLLRLLLLAFSHSAIAQENTKIQEIFQHNFFHKTLSSSSSLLLSSSSLFSSLPLPSSLAFSPTATSSSSSSCWSAEEIPQPPLLFSIICSNLTHITGSNLFSDPH